jgi:DNA-binding winged helix-turn-helix (wHTH) protein/Tol biopolymer transport system component
MLNSVHVSGWRTMQPNPESTVVRFAGFHLDLHSGELYKNGHRIRLQAQPFQVLRLLIEQPGKVVTREELRQKLWPADTFVDFDHGLNSAVARLREALNDSNEAPRFIETIPKRGYRFLQSVVDEAPLQETPEPSAIPSPIKNERSLRLVRMTLVAAFVIVSLSFGIRALLRSQSAFPRVVGSTQITNDGIAKGVYATLATDGVRIYFDEVSGGREFPSQVSALGGETVAVPIPKKGTIYDVSPDGASMLFGAQEPVGTQLWIQPLPAGAPRHVGGILAEDAGWFRDGQHIVYTNLEGLFSVKSDGTENRKIASIKTPAWPRVSPDGQEIRFTAGNEKGGRSIYEVDVRSTNLHPLFPDSPDASNDCCGRWTSDGRYYVFQRAQSGPSNLWIMAGRRSWLLSSRQAHQLTNGPLEFFLPLPSPSGKLLFAIGQQKNSELVRFDIHSRSFVPYLAGVSATQVEISRDGQWAVYVAYPQQTLWRCRLSGSERLQLTAAPMQVMVPHWSPDGMQIAFTALQPGETYSVKLISAAGGDSKTLVSGAYGSAWSAKGDSIAFNRFAPSERSGGGDTTRIEMLDLHNQKISAVPGSEGRMLGDWSKDGRYLLVKTSDHHRAQLFDTWTQQWSEVTHADMLTNLRWARHSSSFFFEATSHEKAILMRMNVADRTSVQVMDFQDIRRPLSQLSAAWLGLAEDDSPIMQRDIGIQELYALSWQVP